MPASARRTAVAFILLISLSLSFINARPEAGGVRRVSQTPRGRVSLNPALSGDGRRLAFESNADLAGTGAPQSFRVFAAGLSNPVSLKELARARGPAPALSQDGASVVFAAASDVLGTNRDGNSELFFRDGTGLTQLTDTLPDDPARRAAQGSFRPSISDDGRLVAFDSDRDHAGANPDRSREIFLYDVGARNFTQLTDDGDGVRHFDAKISGDGSRVAFVRERDREDGTAAREVVIYERAAGGLTVAVKDADKLALAPGRSVSDDGLRVVYSAETSEDAGQVFLFDGRNGGRVRQLTRLRSRRSDVPLHPTLSGDGRRVAFATRRNVTGDNRDASVELYVYDIPTDTFFQITNAPAAATGEVVASLNDEGTVVAFSFPRALAEADAPEDFINDPEIFAASVAPRAEFRTGLEFFNGAALDRSPLPPNTAAPDSIVVATGADLSLETVEAVRRADASFPTELGNVTLRVGGRPAPLFYVSPTQINFHLPADTPLGAAEVAVVNHDGLETRGTINVVRAAPGVFAAGGRG
ncbi:MAG: hypothetical protein M3416_06685, partial [Acidobacteriota bacterium]|nr:hypothetical protein [Acidobacteriota bacterium]